MYTVYVLKSEKDDKLYIGCTSCLEKRVRHHNMGFVKSTSYRRPLCLIFHEEYSDKYEAFKKERFYKTAVGKRILKQKFS